MPPKWIKDLLGPVVRGNEARAVNAMLNTRKNAANAAEMAAETDHWDDAGASTARAPSIAVDRGSTNARRD